MQMKRSARINPSRVLAPGPTGGTLYSHDAGMELFSTEPRQMVVLSGNFFIQVMYGV